VVVCIRLEIESNNARFGGLIGLMVLNIALLNVINLAGQVWSRETYLSKELQESVKCRRDLYFTSFQKDNSSYDKHDLLSS